MPYNGDTLIVNGTNSPYQISSNSTIKGDIIVESDGVLKIGYPVPSPAITVYFSAGGRVVVKQGGLIQLLENLPEFPEQSFSPV